MPKIDPITGCEVMTFFEFLDKEAEREGKEPADIMAEISQSIADDNAYMEEFYRKPENALQIMREWVEGDEDWQDDPDTHCPEEVLEVLEVSYSGSFGGSKTFILARVRCEDGEERIAEFCYQYWSATRMDPADEDADLNWHGTPEAYRLALVEREEKKREQERKNAEARERFRNKLKGVIS